MNVFSSEKAATYKLFFGTLANPKRIEILNVLRKKQLNVTEICISTGFSQTLVSHNLRRLEHCGFVFKEAKGKFRYYSLNKKTIRPLLDLIDRHMQAYCHKIVKGGKKK